VTDALSPARRRASIYIEAARDRGTDNGAQPAGLAGGALRRCGSPAPWLEVANSGRGEALLRACQIEIAAAAWQGIPIILALQSPAEAVRAAAWLRALRPDWSLRHSLELRDALETRGLLPCRAERAKAG
jgi:hypothetical protein